MKTIGIIAEYNPFHNGHAYQIAEIRRRAQADFIVIAMSGDFVQRGAPACADKFTRARMALSCGADLVIELPVLWSAASAEHFAMAGVTLFEKMGCVGALCFGAETESLCRLSALSGVLAEEPEAYRLALSAHLKEGLSFPAARAKALGVKSPNDLLSSPNNILAVEYLKALRRRNSPIAPLLLKREGAGYHEKTIGLCAPDAISQEVSAPAASATAIRELLIRPSCAAQKPREPENGESPAVEDARFSGANGRASDLLRCSMPKHAYSELMEYQKSHPFLDSDDFSEILGYLLLTTSIDTLRQTADITPDIANRIFGNRHSCHSYSDFCLHLKSRNVTYTRCSRILLHLILNLTEQDAALGARLDYIPYLRVLGFRRAAAPLLSELKSTASVPVITKLSAASVVLSGEAYAMLEKDLFAGELYRQVRNEKAAREGRAVSKKSSGSELSQPLVVVP